jgi:biotin carboxylase
MPRVLMLIPSATYRAPDFVAAAQRLEIELVVGSEQGLPLEGVAEGRTLTVDLNDPETGARQIEAFALQYPVDTVVAVDDAGALVAAAASELLGLSHNPFDAVEATRNKYLLRQRLARGELLTPPFQLFKVDDDPAAIADELAAHGGFPCVVKPLALAGSRGVIRADDQETFIAAFERLRELLTDPEVATDCGDTADQVLVEDYIPGVEVSLEGLLVDGELHTLALFDKPDPLEGPFFEETIYVTPSRLPAEVQDDIFESVQRSAVALGLHDGPIHAELRVNEDGIWPIDIAARSIGGLCSRTLSFLAGSLEELILRHAIGAEAPSYERTGAASGVIMIPIPSGGTLEAVRGVQEAEAVAGVSEVTITIRPGQRVVPLPEGSEYLGFIFAQGASPEAVEAALREAHAALQFEISA